MLDMGVIKESNSDWSSPVVLVSKADRSVLLSWLDVAHLYLLTFTLDFD